MYLNIYGAEVKSRQHFRYKNIGRIRFNISFHANNQQNGVHRVKTQISLLDNMRRSRKFCQRRSNFDNIFLLVDEGRKDSDT